MSFEEAEQIGLKAIGDGVVFVLVAGGLGERLGYSGIKLSLETNLCTSKSYLELYTSYIKAMQFLARQKSGNNDIRIPLVIMTSGDTDPLTKQLLEDNDYFGMDRDMVTIVMQDKVAALKDGKAGLAIDDDNRWEVQTKPHGHGDVHHLLYREGLVDKWEAQGLQHVVFLQDTNALVINSIVPALGVSSARGFHMNSICIPRLAEEAAGAITKLEHKTDPSKSLVINVEYNQLDPLLKAQGTGDVPDETTGFSPFPGNANNLVMSLPEYAKTLRGEDQGVVLEFVNPKYKDEKARTDFKKPTRLECMMQDIPKLFQKELSEPKVGFCMFDRWFTFSPAKNALEAGQQTIAKGGSAPGTLSSAESDMYIQNQRKLEFAGFEIKGEDKPIMMAGIPVTSGPHVMLCPSLSISQEELKEKINKDSDLTVTRRSSLVLEGHHLKIDGLSLDGALVIRTGDDTHVTVKDLKVQNKGWTYTDLPEDDDSIPEHIRIRGYTMTKHETAEYLLYEPGHFVIESDGQVTKVE
uniref:UTP-monosaccharide-1-phosphate uridylyltransferase n=2 Tax=Entomoneis paludosa TaxID=265537 RepID=A0A6U3CPP3_9STRA|mmetsp:Transcript_37912/g.78746  ORF Transcript_37912/g.78746 Transcript_37912/m.78746 type:complete len:523 (+) Transcript_37912:257-1825(+)